MKKNAIQNILKECTYADLDELCAIMWAMVMQNINETARFFYEEWNETTNVVDEYEIIYDPLSGCIDIFNEEGENIKAECIGEDMCDVNEFMDIAEKFETKFEYRSIISEY